VPNELLQVEITLITHGQIRCQEDELCGRAALRTYAGIWSYGYVSRVTISDEIMRDMFSVLSIRTGISE